MLPQLMKSSGIRELEKEKNKVKAKKWVKSIPIIGFFCYNFRICAVYYKRTKGTKKNVGKINTNI